jgi:hypothetical protein
MNTWENPEAILEREAISEMSITITVILKWMKKRRIKAQYTVQSIVIKFIIKDRISDENCIVIQI